MKSLVDCMNENVNEPLTTISLLEVKSDKNPELFKQVASELQKQYKGKNSNGKMKHYL